MHRYIDRWIGVAVVALCLCGPALGQDEEDAAGVARRIEERLGGQGVPAEELPERLVQAVKEELGPEDPKTLTIMADVAGRLYGQGKYGRARQLEEEVLAIRRRVLGAEHPDTLAAMNNLAETLYGQGELSNARACFEQVLAGRRDILGAEHPDTLMAMGNLAVTLKAQGDLSGARELEEKVLTIRRRVLGAEHPDTLRAMTNLAVTLKAQGNLSGARELAEEVLAIRRRVLEAEHPNTLTVTGCLADILYAQGDLSRARELIGEVWAIRRRMLGDEHPNTLSAMSQLAEILYSQGDLLGARDLEEEVLAGLRRVLGTEHPSTLTAMNNLAGTLSAQGDLLGARDLEEEALAGLGRVLGTEHPSTLTTGNNLAMTLEAQGDLSGARELLEKVLADLRRVLGTEHPSTLTAMNNLAMTLEAQGDLSGARELLEEVLACRHRLLGAQHPSTTKAMGNLAGILRAQGYLSGARELEEEVLASLRRVLGTEHPDTLTVMGNLALTLKAQGDMSGARALEEDVLASLRRELGAEHPATLMAMGNLAATLSTQGELSVARELEEEVLAHRRRVLGAEHPDTWTTMKNLAVTHYDQGDLVGARQLLKELVSVRQSVYGADYRPDTMKEADTFAYLALVYWGMGEIETAAGFFLQAINALEAQIVRAGDSEDLRSIFRGEHDQFYLATIGTFLRMNRDDDAFLTLERSRAQSFLRMVAERDLVFFQIPPELDADRHRIANRYDVILSALDKLDPEKDRDRITALVKEQKDLRRERELVNAQIRRVSPHTAKLLDPQPLTVDEIRQVLDPGTLLLSYSVGPDRTNLFTLTRSGKLDVHSLPVGEKTLRNQMNRYRGQLHGAAWPELAVGRIEMGKWLFEKLLRSVVEPIEKSQRLLIVPDGPLHYLPFDALIRDTGGESETERDWQYLVEWKPIHTVLSATVYAELQQSRRGKSDEAGESTFQMAAFGDPAYPPTDREGSANRGPVVVRSAVARGYFAELTPLPHSGREVTEIAGLFPESSVRKYLRSDATEEQAKTVGKDVRIVHFAVHGVADPLTPLDSFLAFTIPDAPDEGQDNGLLQAWEIFERVRLDADLVVLSSCHTAFGPERRGEGLISLSRAFQYAGARTVMASLWRVNDQSTAELMIRFYHHLQDGKPKDGALRAAQIELIRGGPIEVVENGKRVAKDYSAPYHWAAFQLIGDWQ